MSENENRRHKNTDEKSDRGYIQNGAMDLPFFITVIVLVTVGLVMLYTASYANAYYQTGNSAKYFNQQAIFAAVGVAAMLLISKISVKFLRKMVLPVYILSLALLVLALAMGKGSFKRWIYVGGISFQPSEIAKFAIILVISHLGAKYYQTMNSVAFTMAPFVAVLPILALTVLEPHMSATIIMVLISVVMVVVAGGNMKFISFVGVCAGGVGVVILAGLNKLSYALDRVKLWLGIAVDTVQTADGWQTQQAIYALGSGGMLGRGFGKSNQKYLYMPEPQNDFIFAIIGEELGFVGALLIIILFGYFVYRGFLIAVRARDKFSSLLALGITFHVGLQAALNLLVVSNVIPNTGISLPFFSYGGTSLLMTLGEMGIMLSISRASTVRKMTSKS